MSIYWKNFPFLPFFLAGFYFNKDYIEKIRSINKLIPICILISILILVIMNNHNIDYTFLYYAYSYKNFNLSIISGILLRGILYLFSFIALFSIINLQSDKKYCFTHVGQATMPIYITHIYIIKMLYKVFPEFNFIILLVTIGIVYIFSRSIFINLYKQVIRYFGKFIFN